MGDEGVLYALNDALAEIAHEYAGPEVQELWPDAGWDAWLNDLTHEVARRMRIEV